MDLIQSVFFYGIIVFIGFKVYLEIKNQIKKPIPYKETDAAKKIKAATNVKTISVTKQNKDLAERFDDLWK